MKSKLTVLFSHACLLVGFVFITFNATSAFGALPNLVPQGITLGATSVVAGGTLAVHWTLANTGSGSSPATVTGVRLNQSPSNGNATPNTSFANVAMPALPANSWTAQSATIAIPAGTTPGTYYVWIIADNVTNGVITQTSYADDLQHSAAFTVIAAPNLVPQGITLGATSVVAGSTLAVHWTLANTGSGSSPATVTGVRLNQSPSNGNATPNTSFANVAMPALPANSWTAQSATIAIPAGTTPGTYYVWIIADNVTNGVITQTSYADDYACSVAFTITGAASPPDNHQSQTDRNNLYNFRGNADWFQLHPGIQKFPKRCKLDFRPNRQWNRRRGYFN